VHLVYDGAANKFLPGNHVVLTDRATQCLTSFSLDFERKSANTADGPDMTVLGHGQRPRGRLHVRPADLPRRPERTGRPQPAGHEASQNNPVGGPANNPLPRPAHPSFRTPTPPRTR
jgi:hypothetical protein